MALDLYAGENHHRNGDASWLIVNWLDSVAPRQQPPGMSDFDWAEELLGSIDYSVDAVRLTDETIPTDFMTAMVRGFLTKDAEIGYFDQSRDFLAQAAKDGVPIKGHY